MRPIIRKWKTFKAVANFPRSGNPSKFLPRSDHALLRKPLHYSVSTLDIKIHKSTIRKRLDNFGLLGMIARGKYYQEVDGWSTSKAMLFILRCARHLNFVVLCFSVVLLIHTSLRHFKLHTAETAGIGLCRHVVTRTKPERASHKIKPMRFLKL